MSRTVTLESYGTQVREFIEEKKRICEPENIHFCDGSKEENDILVNRMIENKMMKRLPFYDDW